MTRHTAAYSGLIKRLVEVETILHLARQASTKPPVPVNVARINALCRSGVLLLSSHIEGYIEELGEIALYQIEQRQLLKSSLGTKFRYHLSRDIIANIKQTTDPSQIADHLDKLLQRDGHIWDSAPNFRSPLPARVFLDFGNPKHEAIKEFFSRFGYTSYEYDLKKRLKANFSPCQNMIDQVVEQRNKIAHGDVVTTGTPIDLFNMIELVKQYCREADCVVADWFKAQKCPIR